LIYNRYKGLNIIDRHYLVFSADNASDGNIIEVLRNILTPPRKITKCYPAAEFILGAFPPPAGTGLSACIFFARGKKGYRSYPLRESKPLRGFDFAEFHFVKLQASSLEFGICPKLRKPKRRAFWFPLRCPETASMPFQGHEFLLRKNSWIYHSRPPCRPEFALGVLRSKTQGSFFCK
jgi:hypothetical protein